MTAIIILVTPMLVLIGSTIAVSAASGKVGIANPGAHGFSEILYALSSAANNNGIADGSGEGILPEAQFTSLKARFIGFEAKGKFNLVDNLDLTVKSDYVRAKNLTTGDDIPRVAPLRIGAGLHYLKNGFGARVDVLHAFNQNRTAVNELAIDGYTDLTALVTYKLPTKLNVELFAKANNLLNEEIREHASILKDISPQGERSVLIGQRSDF